MPADALNDLDQRLANWARAFRWRSVRRAAESFEGRYKSPQPWYAVPTALVMTNVKDAMVVEAAWRACTAKSRWLLKLHHHDGLEPRLTCHYAGRKLGEKLHLSAWPQLLGAARFELTLQLERVDAGVFEPANMAVYDVQAERA